MVQPRVQADLTFSVDGVAGTVTGSGQVLTVRVAEPARMASSLPRGTHRVGEVADLLASSGLRVEVQGPSGLLAQVGSGVDSAVGSWVTGSRHVAPGSVRSLAPVVATPLRRPAAIAGLALLVFLGLRGLRRRSA